MTYFKEMKGPKSAESLMKQRKCYLEQKFEIPTKSGFYLL